MIKEPPNASINKKRKRTGQRVNSTGFLYTEYLYLRAKLRNPSKLLESNPSDSALSKKIRSVPSEFYSYEFKS